MVPLSRLISGGYILRNEMRLRSVCVVLFTEMATFNKSPVSWK